VALFSGACAVALAFLFRAVYFASPNLSENLQSLFRLSEVAGSEVLILALAFISGQFIQLILLITISCSTFKVSYRPLLRLGVESIAASLAGAGAAYATLVYVVEGINQDTFIGISLQGATAGLAGFAAIVLTYGLCRSPELQEIYRSYQSKILKTDVVARQ